jgi:hypothetical protein
VSKKRDFQQRVGRRGEDAFRPFSSRHSLMSTKVEEDVGFDFLCHVEEEGAEDLREITGSVLGISVRASSKTPPRVRLDRSDAEAMLRARFVVCLALVVVKPKSETVYYRFLDEAFARELAELLASERKSMSLTPADCREEPTFEADLWEALKGNMPERVKVAVATHRVRRHLPDAELRIVRGTDDELTAVEVTDFYDYFLRGETSEADDVHAAIFGSPRLRMERLAKLGPRPEIGGEFIRLPAAVLVGGTQESDVSVRATGNGGVATETFTVVRTRTHHGWVHPSGFSISFSKPMQRDEVWVHEITALIDEGEELFLDAEPALWGFLERCSEEAVLSIVGDRPGGVEASHVGNLGRAHFMAQYLRAASTLVGWDQIRAPLRLALDDESMHTLALVARIASDSGVFTNFGFVLEVGETGEVRSSVSLVFDQDVLRVKLPILGNVGQQAVVAWLDAEVRYHRNAEDQVRGIRIEQVLGAQLEVRDRQPKSTKYPELVVDGTWPTVAFAASGPVQTQSDAEEWNLGLEQLEE